MFDGVSIVRCDCHESEILHLLSNASDTRRRLGEAIHRIMRLTRLAETKHLRASWKRCRPTPNGTPQSLCSVLQLTACFGFVRMHAMTSSVTRVFVECMFLAVSWIGWCVLIIRYKIHGEISYLHYLGVGLFVSGGVVYFAFLIMEMYASNEDEHSVLVFLYCATVVFAFLFILGFFSEWDCAWIFEHAAFLMFTVAHNYLFYVDVRDDVSEMGRGLFDSLRIEPKSVCFGNTNI